MESPWTLCTQHCPGPVSPKLPYTDLAVKCAERSVLNAQDYMVKRRVAQAAAAPADLLPRSSGRFLGIAVSRRARRAPRRPASALPSGRIPAVNAAHSIQQNQEDLSDGDDFGGYWDQPAAQLRRDQKRQKALEDNKRLHEKWDACLLDNVFRNTCYLAGEPARQTTFQQQLQAEFHAAVIAALRDCQLCIATGISDATWEQVPGHQIKYVTIQGRTDVVYPSFCCKGCGATTAIDPIDLGCFPATPQLPRLFYSAQLMFLTMKSVLRALLPWSHGLELSKSYTFTTAV